MKTKINCKHEHKVLINAHEYGCLDCGEILNVYLDFKKYLDFEVNPDVMKAGRRMPMIPSEQYIESALRGALVKMMSKKDYKGRCPFRPCEKCESTICPHSPDFQDGR